jgi:hypothetical protein
VQEIKLRALFSVNTSISVNYSPESQYKKVTTGLADLFPTDTLNFRSSRVAGSFLFWVISEKNEGGWDRTIDTLLKRQVLYH